MPIFHYVAVDSKGHEITGEMECTSNATVADRIRALGLFPTDIQEAQPLHKPQRPLVIHPIAKSKRTGLHRISFKLPVGGGTVKSKVLTAFTRQLATLIDAGLPLLRGLDVLRKQEATPVLQHTLGKLIESVENGGTFSEALALHPRIFNKLYVNMVRAGEVGGVMHVTLNRLAEFQEKAQKIKNKVVAAMVYPSVVILVALAIVSFLMMVIVPKFEEIFRDLMNGDSLPALTLMVMGLSKLIKHQFPLLLVGAIASVVGLKALGKTERGRRWIDRCKLNAPVIGQLIRKVSIARFTRTLGTLIASGVPILQALNIVRETVGNAVVANAVRRVHDAVKEGESITAPLAESKIFPPMVVSMIEVGEHTGALPDMMMKVADVYDDEVDNAVSGLTSLLEPVMIVFLAIIVGTIVIAMFLPLIKIMMDLGNK